MFPMKPPIGAQLNRSHRLAQGLAAAWVFNEKSGLTAHDLSGNGNDGTLTDMTPATAWVPSTYGGGLDFQNGSRSYVDIGTRDYFGDGTSPYSMFFQFDYRGAGAGAITSTLLSKRADTYTESKIRWVCKWHQRWTSNLIWNNYSWEKPSLDPGSYTVAFVCDGNTTAYVNGISLGTQDGVSVFGDNAAALTADTLLGGIKYWDSSLLGDMNVAALFNRALSANEIAELYFDPYAAFRPSLSIFPALESTSAKTGSADVTDSVSVAEQVAGDDDYDSAFVKFENLPDLTGKTITSAKVYLYGEETELTEGFDLYFDVVGVDAAWSSASSVATLEALSFNASVSSGVGTTLGAWHEYDILGDATKGLQKIYTDAGGDPSALIATLKIKVDPDFFTADITDPNFIGVGNNGDARWAEETDATFFPYIVIQYETAVSYVPYPFSRGARGGMLVMSGGLAV